MLVVGSIDGYLMKEAYRDMASALSKADGIDYTDPEELLVATIMDLDAMDGKGSVSLLAKCSTSPNVNTRLMAWHWHFHFFILWFITYQNQLLKMINVGGSSICLGDCPPDAILPHEECNKANKIAYYSELHKVLGWYLQLFGIHLLIIWRIRVKVVKRMEVLLEGLHMMLTIDYVPAELVGKNVRPMKKKKTQWDLQSGL
ncbi:unnamed protein product [Lactuca saligna]|uniref:Uncharacterized protein n=1 Tax=Lactuca saligna TaxID=75948 RepID=A0AA36EDK3_LACSI|nr:unnamed protein product [Lactuca saligna]